MLVQLAWIYSNLNEIQISKLSIIRILFALDLTRFLAAIFGLLANIVCFIVFSHEAFDGYPIRISGRALAILDSLALLPALLIDYFSIRFSMPLTLYSSSACKWLSFLTDAFTPNTAWIIALFGIDTALMAARMSGSCVQNRFTRAFSNNRFRVYTIVVTVLWNLGFALPIPAIVDILNVNVPVLNTKQIIEMCASPYIIYPKILHIMYYIGSIIMPVVIMVISMSATIWYRIQWNRCRVTGNDEKLSENWKNHFNSIGLSLVFVVTTLPIMFTYFGLGDDFIEANMINKFAGFFYLSSNFLHLFVHIVTNSLFRKQCMNLFVWNCVGVMLGESENK